MDEPGEPGLLKEFGPLEADPVWCDGVPDFMDAPLPPFVYRHVGAVPMLPLVVPPSPVPFPVFSKETDAAALVDDKSLHDLDRKDFALLVDQLRSMLTEEGLMMLKKRRRKILARKYTRTSRERKRNPSLPQPKSEPKKRSGRAKYSKAKKLSALDVRLVAEIPKEALRLPKKEFNRWEKDRKLRMSLTQAGRRHLSAQRRLVLAREYSLRARTARCE